MRKAIGTKLFGSLLIFIAVFIAAGYFTMPVNRINMRSRLVMLGDFNSDNKWDQKDAGLLSALIADPFSMPEEAAYKADINHNGLLDDEDAAFLK